MTTRLELYVRSLSASEARTEQETVVEQLATLVERGLIDEYSVDVWGEELCQTGAIAETEPGRAALELVAEFRAWAEATGRSLTPFFERRTVHRSLTGEGSRLIIKLPVMTLAAYRDGELTFVAPCREGETVHSVGSLLDELLAEEHDAPEFEKRERSLPVYDSRPFRTNGD